MSYTLVFTDSYKKCAKRFAKQHSELKEPYRRTLLLLAQNPYHPSLRLHPLKGKLAALHSVSINLNYRV
ncbi:type II toxin-antitoxin system YafQ family toxin [Crenothrix polyspora]|uniref:Uncharacterized protein n=1 Tax=Crenothrix polyspora TaxID=360316 RepID=A0A1R4HJ29_9GAMM|nr:type II toxin-antitoxin system YafQ family toxin [Crenothrix polyspora]SJM96209.1 conserved hypothetical protein [Crenothrix polyspora]